MNRPKAYNALNSAINRDIMSALELVKADKNIRVLIMTGNEKAFAAGADIKEMATATPRYAREFCGLAIEINNILENLPIPTIAAINGLAWGGGCEMTLACDFRVGGPHTSLCFPEVGLGIIPGANGCARATAIVGPSKAKELVMFTKKVKGEEAYALGLLNRLVDDSEVYNEAVNMAKELMKQPGCALTAAKTAINKAAKETISQGMMAETTEFTLLFDTHDQKEGMAAMMEKRAAEYTNN